MVCWGTKPGKPDGRTRLIPQPPRPEAGQATHIVPPFPRSSIEEPALGTATIRDVAKQARVSLKTVSRVINREDSVREETRDRVLRAIEQLGYRPDLSARSLRSAKAYAIGLVYDNPNPYYIIAVQQGALSACREMGFGLQIHPCVFVDDRDAAYAITAYLIQLGHVRIGFLWGGKQHRSSPERYKGYEKAL